MNRNFEYGKTPEEVRIGRHAMTKTDHEHRVKERKTYHCARCNAQMTVYEHVKFLAFCKRCTENGANHMTLGPKGRIEVTN